MPRSLYIIWSVCITALLIACGPGGDKVRVKGNFSNVRRAEIYFYCADGTSESIDTLRIEGGKFKGEITVSEPTLYTLLLQNFTEYSIILEPKATITIQGDAQKLAAMEVTGTDENQLLTDFRRSTFGKSSADVQRAASDFIRNHPQTLAAVAILRDVYARNDQPNADLVQQLLTVLKKAQPKSRALRNVEQSLKSKLICSVGQPLPNFTATDINGRTINSGDYKGQSLLVAFVATWTNRHNEMMRAINAVGDNAPEGMKILIISLDTDIERLRTRLQNDSLPATVICDGKAFDSPTATVLGAQYLPSCMLVGSDGRIKARYIQPEKLTEAVKKLE